MKIYGFPMSPRTFKVLVAANHLGLDYTFEMVDLTKGEQLQPKIVALNPDHRVPILEDGGYVLWESNAILQYLAAKRPEAGLLPLRDIKAELDVLRWLYWDCAHWDVGCSVLIFENLVKSIVGMGDPDPVEVEHGTKLFARSADVLEKHLAKQRFINGERLTIADFALGSPLLVAEGAHYPLENYPAIRRWHGDLSALPAWQRTIAATQPAASAA
ncbi:MAG: glutathione S-transferase family protein [Methylovirgula sp.]|jgi:glutathione S-transferase